MSPNRQLNPRFQQHIARARRMRIIGGALLVTCLLIGTGAALSQTQLPHQLTATLKPIASSLSDAVSQLPSTLSDRIPNFDTQLPRAANQLAASATSFPQSIAEKVRNLFCRWLTCGSDTLIAQQPAQPSIQQRATLPQNVKQPASIPSPTGDATTTTQVVVSSASVPASTASPSTPAQQVIQQPVIERTNTIIQSGLTAALLDARLLALTNDLNSRLNQVAGARAYQAERTAENVADATRIEQLTGLTAHDLTVDGVSGLTDADLPDSLTASNYLPLSGGSLTGNLSLSGTLTAGTLAVAGISSGGAIAAPYFTATSSTATSTFAGAVSIGTTSPQTALHVVGSSGSFTRFDRMTTGASSRQAVSAFNALSSATIADGFGPTLVFNAQGSGTNLNQLGGIAFVRDGADNSGAFVIVPTAAGSSAERLRVTSAGNVGIGTTTPFARLSVAGNGFFDGAITATNITATGTLAVGDFATAGLRKLNIAYNSVASILTNGTDDLDLGANNTAVIHIESDGAVPVANTLVLDAGNVGIGTTNPTYKLDVSGLGRFTGLVDAANFVATSTSATSTFAGSILALGPAQFANSSIFFGETKFGATGTTTIATDGTISTPSIIANSATLYSATLGSLTATSSLTVSGSALFSNGFLSLASSTIGNGTQTGGLTISGGATTTGNAYFAGNVGIGTASPSSSLHVNGIITSGGAASAGTVYLNSTAGTLKGFIYTDGTDAFVGASGGSANLHLRTGGGNRLTVTSTTGNVGIGTTSPLGKLNVYSGASGVSAADSWVDDLVIENNNHAGISILNPDAFIGSLQFGSNSGNDNARITGTYNSGSPYLALWTNDDASGDALERLRITSTGNVGIASTTPYAKLSITNTGTGPSFVVEDSTSPDTTPFIIDASGNVGIGTSSPAVALDVWGGTNNVGQIRVGSLGQGGSISFRRGSDGASHGAIGASVTGNDLGIGTGSGSANVFLNAAGSTGFINLNTNGAERVRINHLGNVGVASTTPWRTLSVTGTVGFDGLTGSTGAGSLCLDANKQVVYNDASDSCLSSTRATKHDIQPLTLNALGMIEGLEPVSFVYNEGNDRTRFGFIAEDTAAIDPHLATYNASGTVSGIDDRAILSILVAAIKDVASITGSFKSNLIAWLAEAENGIQDLFAKNLHAENVTAHRGSFEQLTASSTVSGTLSATDQLCLGSMCITESQFMAVFSQTAGAAASISVPPPASNISEPPATDDPPISVSSSTPEVTGSEDDLTNSEQPPHENSTTSEPTSSPYPSALSSEPEAGIAPAEAN